MLKVFPVEDEVIIREALRDSIPREKKVGVLPERAATDASRSGNIKNKVDKSSIS